MSERRLSYGSLDDVELISLGKQFERRVAVYWTAVDQLEAIRSETGLFPEEPDTDQMSDELLPFLRAITALQAHTEAGRRVKLLALAYALDCTDEGLRVLPEGTDVLSALEPSIARDFLQAYGIALRDRPQAAHQPSARH